MRRSNILRNRPGCVRLLWDMPLPPAGTSTIPINKSFNNRSRNPAPSLSKALTRSHEPRNRKIHVEGYPFLPWQPSICQKNSIPSRVIVLHRITCSTSRLGQAMIDSCRLCHDHLHSGSPRKKAEIKILSIHEKPWIENVAILFK